MTTADRIAAAWLRWMGWIGLILSLLVFFAYASGLWPSDTTPEESAALWSLPSEEYLEQAGQRFGPIWFTRPADGYRVSTAALAILATTALPALTALSLSWLRRRDVLHGVMALAIALVLVAAILG